MNIRQYTHYGVRIGSGIAVALSGLLTPFVVFGQVPTAQNGTGEGPNSQYNQQSQNPVARPSGVGAPFRTNVQRSVVPGSSLIQQGLMPIPPPLLPPTSGTANDASSGGNTARSRSNLSGIGQMPIGVDSSYGQHRHGYGNYLYTPPVGWIGFGGPSLLGGFYFSNYTVANTGASCYPSVYSIYSGFPGYIYSPDVSNVEIVPGDAQLYWSGGYIPYSQPIYNQYNQYNQYNYYDSAAAKPASSSDAQNPGVIIIKDGDAPSSTSAPAGASVAPGATSGAPAAPAAASPSPAAPAAVGDAALQQAFADIVKGWQSSDFSLIKKHLRDDDVKIAIWIDGKYVYSIATKDYTDITRDALDRLTTVSFDIGKLRKLEDGGYMGFGTHSYKSSSDDTTKHTVYVSYTLEKHGADWYVTAVDSSSNPLDTADSTSDAAPAAAQATAK